MGNPWKKKESTWEATKTWGILGLLVGLFCLLVGCLVGCSVVRLVGWFVCLFGALLNIVDSCCYYLCFGYFVGVVTMIYAAIFSKHTLFMSPVFLDSGPPFEKKLTFHH